METLGTINYGNLSVVPGYTPEISGNGSVMISGSAVVLGDLTVEGKINGTKEIKGLIATIDSLKTKLNQLQEKVEMLWYSPNMPGYELSKTEWDEKVIVQQRRKSL